jgi:hypothetical protein
MKYKIELSQAVIERTTLDIEAHSQEQAELIAQYIAENGKDPWDRRQIDVTWQADEVQSGPEVISCNEDETLAPDNTMPEHTEGLFAAERT